MSLAASILYGTAGVLRAAARAFLTTALVIDVGLNLLMAFLSFWIAADGSTWRGLLAALLGVILIAVVGFVIAWQSAVRTAVTRAIQDTGIGGQVLDALLNACGFSGAMQQCISLPDLSRRLALASNQVNQQEDADSDTVGWKRALVRRVHRTIVWLTEKALLHTAGSLAAPDGTVRLGDVQNALATTVDRRIGDYMMDRFRKLSLTLLAVACAVTALMAWGIRQLPI